MSTAIEFERLKNGIIDFNLTRVEEPIMERHGGQTPCGFLTELYLEPRSITRKAY